MIDVRTLEPKLALAELGRVAYFRPDTLPMGFQPELMVTRHTRRAGTASPSPTACRPHTSKWTWIPGS